MSLSLAILHGEQALVGFALAGLIVVIGTPLLLYVWLWHTRITALKLASAYFVSVALLCIVLALSTFSPISLLSLTAYSLCFILSLPWSVLAGGALWEIRNSVLSDRELTVVMFFGACVNAVLLYFAAAKMRRLIE